jgi:Protein of unknown function (DUF1360)
VNIWVAFVLLSLAGYRLTRLIVVDTFPPIAYVRERLTGENNLVRQWSWVPTWLEYLAGCTWCVSVWTTAVLTWLVDLSVGLPVPLLVWGAVAGAAAWLCHLEDFFDRD